jgi:hypothetical protein
MKVGNTEASLLYALDIYPLRARGYKNTLLVI